jgi:hypothetical protein
MERVRGCPIRYSIIIPDQRQLVVAINCTPDAGVVSCRFGSDSHTICRRPNPGQRYETKDSARARKGMSYASVSFFANKLVLERGTRRQVHRCAPHGVIGRIQWDLCRASLCQ